ncbi:MAG: DUF433 domain-containing protein [Actinomycetota bacterium]
MGSRIESFDGCYEASRAAALAGVPVSTVYHWARHGVVVPSVSPVKEKLWSYADLMALRVIHWLRHPKVAEPETAASPMSEVRRALGVLNELGIDIWSEKVDEPSPIRVDRNGRIFIVHESGVLDARKAGRLKETLDLLGPFEVGELRGPDLRQPRPRLRIVPGKCAGEPHLVGSRLTTIEIGALADRGFSVDAIYRLYPDEDRLAIAEALDLERQLVPLAA